MVGMLKDIVAESGFRLAFTEVECSLPAHQAIPVKAYEIYQTVDPALVSEMFSWMKDNETDLYKTAIASLAADRKLRPIFVQKKTFPDQVAWLQKTLKLRTSDSIGEHLLQVWFMKGQQELLISFCDGMGIEHDGEGSVDGELPKSLDAAKLKTTIDSLLEKKDPKLVTLYLTVFNLQTATGWESLTKALESDERLKLA